VFLNLILHYIIRYKNRSTAGLHKEDVMTGDIFIVYSCQLIDVTEWCVFSKIIH